MDVTAERPRAAETQPPLGVVGQAWRLAVCLAFGIAIWSQAAPSEWAAHRTTFVLEIVFGAIALVVVVFRRRAPVLVAAATACLSAFSGLAAGPATLGAVSMATHRRPVPIIGIGLLNFACAMTYTLYAPFDLRGSLWLSVVINVVVNAGMMGWGMYIGSRRELVLTLRQRAARAEADQELRVARGRSQERERIAREMHDVLAHRITQISMQAGALAFRDDLAAGDLRDGLEQIQAKSNEAIQDLRGVLGVLRDASTGQLVEGPQPTYARIAGLVTDARANGTNVDLVDHIDTSGPAVPDAVGRTLFRIIQEGITNATKHAPGAHVDVELRGSPEHGIDVLVSNPLGFAGTAAPGSGLGLVGLAERVELRGGTLSHGREGPLFVLRGSIPWSP